MRTVGFIIGLSFSLLWGQQPLAVFFHTPVQGSFSVTNGYESNVLRLSETEQEEAALQPEILGEMSTFDSHYIRGSVGLESVYRLKNRKKRIELDMDIHGTSYTQSPDKTYWSGSFSTGYRWGSYRRIEYSLSHLNDYYLRHYVNRDVSSSVLADCRFTDHDQSIAVSHPLMRRTWAKVKAGYLQRYYDVPFTEFDLDINYGTIRLYRRLKLSGTASAEFTVGRANNISLGKTGRSSDLDRSYRYTEWYIPVSFQFETVLTDEIGIAVRTEHRYYDIEDFDDPLHSGRDHVDMKWDAWVEKAIGKSVSLRATVRYRRRTTYSEYEWVEALKSFSGIQAWIKFEWDFVYDRY